MQNIYLMFIFVLVIMFSCMDKQKSTNEKELPELLGPETTIRIAPSEASREEVNDFTITFKIGREGLPARDTLGIVNGSFIDRWKFSFESHWWGPEQPWQTTDKHAPGYITATCSRKDVNLTLKVGIEGPKKPFVNTPDHFIRSLRERMRFVLQLTPDQHLQPGDVLTIHWKNARAPDYAMHYFFLPFFFSKLPGLDRYLPIRTGDFYRLPHIRVKGHTAEYLHVTCRPLHAVDDSFDINIAAVDRYGNLAEDFTGRVTLTTEGDGNFLKTITFSKEDRGHKRISNLKLNNTGWFKIKAEGEGIAGISNYLVISDTKPAQQLYFGDMHVHTLDCDGTNDIREHYFYAPNVAGLDFGCVSPHAEYFGSKKAWDRYLKETTRAYQPHKFVTFYGYEWAQEGHTNAYFLSEKDAVLVWGEKRMREKGYPKDNPEFRIGAASEKEFMTLLEEQSQTRPVFTIAHIHSAYNDLNDNIHWLDEMYSIHQAGRQKRENRLRNNLAKGLRLGVVAGSDMHRLTMGHLCQQPGQLWIHGDRGGWDQTAGLQVTFATELTRQDLYTAMKNRRSYGTTGARIVLLFSCNNSQMGSLVQLRPGENPTFNIDVGGTTDLAEIAICRYDGKTWTEPEKIIFDKQTTDRYSGSWTEQGIGQTGIYYVRVTQKDGEQAWSSPVWVNR